MAEKFGKIEVVIKGGKPWGFRLQSISENRSTITITEILPGGKADLHGKLRVGDSVIKINGIQCLSLGDALQLIESAFRTLTILVWRPSQCAVASVSLYNKVLKPIPLTLNEKRTSLNDSYIATSAPIYENLQDLSLEKPQISTNSAQVYSLDSFEEPIYENFLTSLQENKFTSNKDRKLARSFKNSSSVASSNSCMSNHKNKWNKEYSPLNPKGNCFTELKHKKVPSNSGFSAEYNSISLKMNIEKENCLSNLKCEDIGVNTQIIDKPLKSRDSTSTWTENVGCVYPNCQNESQACKKHSPPERDSEKPYFKHNSLNPSELTNHWLGNDEKFLTPSSDDVSKKGINLQIGRDSSVIKESASANPQLTALNIALNNMNIYSNICELNSLKSKNLNEDIFHLPQTNSNNCNLNINNIGNLKEKSLPNSFTSNKNILSTEFKNELNQKSSCTNLKYSNIAYDNLMNNIQFRKNCYDDISNERIKNKHNLYTDETSNNIKLETRSIGVKKCDKIVNQETNMFIDRGTLSNDSYFSEHSKMKEMFSVKESCLPRDKLSNRNNAYLISKFEYTPNEISSVIKGSLNEVNGDEKISNSPCSTKSYVSDSFQTTEFVKVHSNASDTSLLNFQNSEEIIYNNQLRPFTPDVPNYENIEYLGLSSSGVSCKDVLQDKNLDRSESTAHELPKNNRDETLCMVYNKSSISTSVVKYSTISSENNKDKLDELQLLKFHSHPEIEANRLSPPLPSPPAETETEILENDDPLPPPPFLHDLTIEYQEDPSEVQAVYANIEMLRIQCSLVSSATQTTLQRKDHSKIKDFTGLPIDSRQSKGTDDKESHVWKSDKKVMSTQLMNDTSQVQSIQIAQKLKKKALSLPLTSPYFTTSVPKAKLLTQHTSKFDEKNFPVVEELSSEKKVLIDSLAKKLRILQQEKDALEEELTENEELGKSLSTKIEELATESENQKFKLYVEELEKITNLLISLSGRLARTENALLILPTESSEEKEVLQDKYARLKQQYDEAVLLQNNIEKRNKHVSLFLGKYLSRDELIDYEHFVHMKVKLLVDYKDLLEKIKLGEEQLTTLESSFDAKDCNSFDVLDRLSVIKF